MVLPLVKIEKKPAGIRSLRRGTVGLYAEAIGARGRAPYRAVDVEGEELESHGGSG
jgi:hypothetical protein